MWSGFRLGWPYGGSCHTDAEGDNGDLIGNTAALCTPAATQYTGSAVARLVTGSRPVAATIPA